MISHSKRFVFVHIPKTAGTSIERLLGAFDDLERGAQDHRTIREIEAVDFSGCLSLLRREGPVSVAKELRGLLRYPHRISRGRLDDYFKFTIVRNPWARVHSWYRNVMRDEVHQQNRGIPGSCSLQRFLTEFGWQTELRPQTDWITDRRGQLAMDYVGRFENLQGDLVVLAEKLNLNLDQMPHLVASDNADYRDAFDSDSRMLVSKRYAREIELFGYEF